MKFFILIFSLLLTLFSFAQNCDCVSNFEWVKKTFEENDAGFQYALITKGEKAYAVHNDLILDKVKNAKTLTECAPILYEWLEFFRSGHISIQLNEQKLPTTEVKPVITLADWDTYDIDDEDFKKYLDNKMTTDYEGIWETEPYTIGIIKEGDGFIGFIINSGVDSWTKGQLKLKFSITEEQANAVYYMRDHSAVESNIVVMMGKNHLMISNFIFSRMYPRINEERPFYDYFKSLVANSPYLEKLNETTLLFRIPSFRVSEKPKIDSVIEVNRELILSTENLIIDIRNGTGGSDLSFSEILPFLYTNPIRTVGNEYLSTKLNNQRMLDFINKPEYGFNESDKRDAKNAFEKLNKELGKFVNLNDNVAIIGKLDTVYPYPKTVGIIVNHNNGSTDESFLLAAKQSKKVKLFGITTRGVLDISNHY